MVATKHLADLCVHNTLPRVKFDELGHLVYADFYAMRLDRSRLARLCVHSKIEHLSLAYTNFSDEDMHHLIALSQLRWVSFKGTGITGPGIEGLTSLQVLTHFDLHHCKLNVEAFHHLSNIPSLKTLILSNTTISDADLPAFRSLSNLRLLYVRYTKLTENAIVRLEHLLPNCRIKRFAMGSPTAHGVRPSGSK